MRFYGDYRKSKEWDLRYFYEGYTPEIVEGEYTCVGLGLELIARLSALSRSAEESLYLVSCEEAVEGGAGYLQQDGLPSASAEKEHVLVAAKIDISGRQGVLLLDPGYHVARVVTVMRDSHYPHTGWFTQSIEPWVKREYRYFFAEHAKEYVVWEVKETRGENVKILQNLIYVGQPFENAVEFTEKRNLAYNFKSWLARNSKGEIVGGLYFGVDESGCGQLTVTSSDSNANKHRLKLSFSDLLHHKELSSEASEVLSRCGEQLGRAADFTTILRSLAQILADIPFVSQLLDINQQINNMTP